MTALVQGLRRSASTAGGRVPARFWWVSAIVGLVVAASAGDSALQALVLSTLADAYLQVSTFVALTLALLIVAERLTGFDTVAVMEKHRALQVPLAALLGALPGCGGAIVVATQYAAGRLSFGALLATLTATMGDAAFLLLAREPVTGVAVFALGAVLGIVTGVIANALHGDDFLRPARSTATGDVSVAEGPSAWAIMDRAWLALMAPGVVFGLAGAAQIELDLAVAGIDLVSAVGVAGAVLAVLLWLVSGGPGDQGQCAADTCAPAGRSWSGVLRSVARDTNFVTVWVVAAFLAYEVTVHVLAIDLAALFAGAEPLVILLAILVGFVPGCGPQIVVTGLYLTGALPLAALIGNAISNDGDALFPAIALAPRAAMVATLYSAVPAVIVAYALMMVSP